MVAVASLYRETRDGTLSAAETVKRLQAISDDIPFINGFHYARKGLTWTEHRRRDHRCNAATCLFVITKVNNLRLRVLPSREVLGHRRELGELIRMKALYFKAAAAAVLGAFGCASAFAAAPEPGDMGALAQAGVKTISVTLALKMRDPGGAEAMMRHVSTPGIRCISTS